MSYTIMNAYYANPEMTAVVVETAESAAVLASEVDTPELWQAIHSWGTPVAYSEPQPPVVTQVTSAQAKIALYKKGLFDQVKSIIPQYGMEASLWFDNANTWDRGNPYVQGITAQLGLTPEQEDDLWNLAALQA